VKQKLVLLLLLKKLRIVSNRPAGENRLNLVALNASSDVNNSFEKKLVDSVRVRERKRDVRRKIRVPPLSLLLLLFCSRKEFLVFVPLLFSLDLEAGDLLKALLDSSVQPAPSELISTN
jgi:hypothetical protein